MKEDLLAKLSDNERPELQQLKLREQLQHIILQEMDRMGLFKSICFVGGTALRILHDLKRFSEDLDFSSTFPLDSTINFQNQFEILQNKLRDLGLNTQALKKQSKQAVYSTFFSFQDLLHELNPKAFRKKQLLSIKIEVDTNPPTGAHEMLSAVSGERLYSIRHYDLPSLFAGKLHAILFRNYTKGRDLYDFIWYTSRHTKVNKTLLENAMAQTEGHTTELTKSALKERLQELAATLDFKQAQRDVARFLVDPREAELIQAELFKHQIDQVKFENATR